jgi:hypothetical protein
VRVEVPAGDAPANPEVALDSILIVAAPADSEECRARCLGGAETCMGVVRNSFALDPTDRRRASERLRVACALADAVPCWELSYPRQFDLLPQVRELVRSTLEEEAVPGGL